MNSLININRKKIENKSKIYFVLVFIFAFSVGCKVTRNTAIRHNLAYLYNKSESFIHPEFEIYHINDSISKVYFKILSSELQFAGSPGEKESIAKFEFNYKVYLSYNSNIIVDSATVSFTKKSNSDSIVYYNDNFNFRAKYNNNYLLELNLKDNNRHKTVKFFFNVYKKNKNGRQNFLLTDTFNHPIYKSYVSQNSVFNINYNTSISKYKVRFYKKEFPIAQPPFGNGNEKTITLTPDSTFFINANNKQNGKIKFNKTGIYQIVADTLVADGFTLMVFNKGFPNVTSADNMLQPLRYITSKQEFNKMAEAVNKRAAVDNFWIETAGNPDRAKIMIRNYYLRLQYANDYFSSFIEGWKTDRGMIYIVFGEPNIVYKSENSEVWIYGEVGNLNSVTFNFLKLNNLFSDNDYTLSRSPIYKTIWYSAIDLWRR